MDSIRWNYFILIGCVAFFSTFGLWETGSPTDSIYTWGFRFNPALIAAGFASYSISWCLFSALKKDWDTWTYFLVCSLGSFILVTSLVMYQSMRAGGFPFIEAYVGFGFTSIVLASLGSFLVSLPIQWLWSYIFYRSGAEVARE
ncbi:MAG: hypothetical protein J5I65_03425 [Aridibacter famidurans]|nr:hypothetical protein [Aridibacter famidurans]